MRLDWSPDGYLLTADSPREAHLIVDMLIEASYTINRLSNDEYVARFGRSKEAIQDFIDNWNVVELSQLLSARDFELVRNCFSEALDFFSDREYLMRTGWSKVEAIEVYSGIMALRRKITIARQWGEES